MFSSNVAFEVLVLRSLIPDAWRVAGGEMCILESFCWFEVRSHLENGFLNLSPLYTHVSRKVISLSEISAVNFMVG